MNKVLFPALALLIFQVACQSPSKAAGETAQDWQKKSLKGITSIKYGMPNCDNYKYTDDVEKSLGELKVKTKRIENMEEDYGQTLAPNEARVKVIAVDREKGQAWVGVTVEQRCRLERIPSINVDSETYKIGKLCPRSKVESTVKELCADFVKDFSTQ